MMIHCSNGRRSFPFREMNWKIYSKSSMREKVQKNHKMNEAKREKKKEQADWNMTQKDTYCLPLLGSPLPLFYTLVSGCPKVNVLKWWWCEDSHRWSHKTCTNCLPYSTFQSDFYQSFTGPQRFLVVTTNRKIEYSMISFKLNSKTNSKRGKFNFRVLEISVVRSE